MKNWILIFILSVGLMSHAQFGAPTRSLTLGNELIVLPHITSATGGFKTEIIVQSTNNLSNSYQLIPYDAAGNMLDFNGYEGQIQAGEAQVLNASEIFGDLEGVTHLALRYTKFPSSFFDVTGEVIVSARYARADGSGIAARVDQARLKGSTLRTFPADWSKAFDGLAVVNAGLATTDVWLTHYDRNGEQLQQIQLAEDLAPMGKVRYLLGDWNGSAFTPTEGSYFEISGSQNLAAMALRGTQDGLLWSNHLDAVNAKAPDVSPIFLAQPQANGDPALISFTYQHAESLVVTWDREGGLDCGNPLDLCGMNVPDLDYGDEGLSVNIRFEPPQPGTYNIVLTFSGPGGEREFPLEFVAPD